VKRALALLLALLIWLPAPAALAAPFAGRRVSYNLRDGDNGFRQLVRTIGVKSLVGILVGGLVAGGLSNHHETAREGHIPLAFDEISQVERDAAAQGVDVQPYSHYLLHNNDLVMKAFEASNLSYEKLRMGSHAHKLARELEIKMTQRQHSHEMPDLFKGTPGDIAAVRQELGPITQTAAAMRNADSDLANAWDESHVDNYHTEFYTETVDDGNGKSHTELRSREVYDDTTHTYTYNRGPGEAASADLDRARAAQPQLSIPESLRTTSATHAEGQYAAEKSRGLKPDQRFTQDQAMKIANTWATGSTYNENVGKLVALWNGDLRADGNQWRNDKNTAHYERYKTTSHSDPGPREYQTSSRALGDGQDFVNTVERMTAGIDYTQQNAPILEAKIRQLIAIELDHNGNGNSKQLAADIIKIAKTMYKMNFDRGVNPTEFRTWLVVLWTVMGAAAGGALGKSVEPTIEYFRSRRRFASP
jgi:hypothetical protein